MTRPLVLVDLDDTLFQTAGKCAPEERPHCTVAARAGNGRHSLMTRRQRAFCDWLLATSDVIPVTARSSEAYCRVDLPFAAGAVVAHGAVILTSDGDVDQEWRERMGAELPAHGERLADTLEQGRGAAAAARVKVRSWIVEESGQPAYAVFKQEEGDGTGLAAVHAGLAGCGSWELHWNGNNLAVLPPPVSKRRAAAFLLARVRERDPSRPVLGLGDSLSDLGFLQLCDWWGMPARSQIASAFGAVTEAAA